MPVDFLTAEQKAEYGKFNNELTSEQLATYFFFDDTDKKNIYKHRGEHNKLGFAIQLGTVRFLGTLLSDIKLVPTSVVQYISQRLKINLDKINLDKYYTSKSRRNHNNEIRQIYGYYDFAEQSQYFKFIRWLYNSAWLTSEGPNIFFEHAITQCRKQRILLPGITVMERLISQVRERTKVRLWKKLSKLPTDEECRQLENLLTLDKKTHRIFLEKLRQQCTDASLKGFLKAIRRYKEIAAIKTTEWNICNLPMIKIQSLARYVSTCRVQTLEKMSYERRMAILVSFIIVFIVSAKDNVVDYMERYFSELFNKAKRNDNSNWLYSKKDFNNSARKLSEVCLLLLDESIPDNDIRNIIFSKIPRENLQSSIGTVDNLTTPADQDFEYKELFRYYKSIRRFLPELLATIDFKSSKAGIDTLLAWNFLRDVEKKKGKNKFVNAPTKEISTSWQKVVLKDSNKINPCAYTFCTIEKMLKGIKNYDIYLEKSNNYNDPRSKLITTNEWEKISSKILKILGWSKNFEESLKPLKEKIDKEYKKTIDGWEKNKSVRIDKVKGKEKIILSHLDKLEEPDSLILLKKRVNSLLPNTNLPELLIEIARLTSFTKQFTHISQNNSRIKDFDISICAVLIANACNIGIEPLVQPGIPALEYDRLTWVERNYFRTETLIKANAVLIEYLSKLAIVKIWGNGNVASADGLRHIVSLKTIYAAPNPHYFGLGRGLTSYKLISDIFGGLNRLVITGTLRDSLYLLELVLGQQTSLTPNQIMTDTAGYSDIIFGLFALLGYQFSPRIADSGSSRLWKFKTDSDYRILGNFSKNKIRETLISKYWDDMLRIAGSLKLGNINPTSLIKMLQNNGKSTILGRAISEFGKIHKTMHLLKVMNDDEYRRNTLTQLNRGESQNGLERIIMYGKKGILYKATREGQEEQLNSLGLVANIIVVWNTIYIQEALHTIQNAGLTINENDKKRLSPLVSEHINIVGYYPFNLSDEILLGKLRPLKKMYEPLFTI